jgi:hypothetical protein
MQKYEELNHRKQNRQRHAGSKQKETHAEDLVLFLALFFLASFACAEKLNPDPTKRYTLNVVFTAMPQG